MASALNRLTRLPTLLGWTGGIGLALMASALFLAARSLLPAYGENQALNDEIQRLEGKLALSASTPLSAADLRRQLEAFLSALPEQNQINTLLNRLHELAARHRLSLKNGEYQLANAKAGRLSQSQIAVKTDGAYSDVRAFLRDVARQLPSMTLARVTLSRQKLADTTLDVALGFALIFRTPES